MLYYSFKDVNMTQLKTKLLKLSVLRWSAHLTNTFSSIKTTIRLGSYFRALRSANLYCECDNAYFKTQLHVHVSGNACFWNKRDVLEIAIFSTKNGIRMNILRISIKV